MLVLVPVKSFHQAKTRLSGILSPSYRRALAKAMMENTIDIVLRTKGATGCCVVTADMEVARTAVKLGASVAFSELARGLNAELEKCLVSPVVADHQSACILHADLAHLQHDDVQGLLQQETPMIALDGAGTGTNAMSFQLSACPPLSYGKNSAFRHMAALGQSFCQLRRPGLAFDVDEPSDYSKIEISRCGSLLSKFFRRREAVA